jgi:hypothetical protein
MDPSVLLGTVLGLAAAYWLLSTLCSFLLEFIHTFQNTRGEALVGFVADMLGAELSSQSVSIANNIRQRFGNRLADPQSPGGRLAQRFFEHPIIAAMEKPKWSANGENTVASYVPAELFARVLVDIIVSMPAAGAELVSLIDKAALPASLKDALKSAVSNFSGHGSKDVITRLENAAAAWLQRSPFADFDPMVLLEDGILPKDIQSRLHPMLTAPTEEQAHAIAAMVAGVRRWAAGKLATNPIPPDELTKWLDLQRPDHNPPPESPADHKEQAPKGFVPAMVDRVRQWTAETRTDDTKSSPAMTKESDSLVADPKSPSDSQAAYKELSRKLFAYLTLKPLNDAGFDTVTLTGTRQDSTGSVGAELAQRIVSRICQRVEHLTFADLRQALSNDHIPLSIRRVLLPLTDNAMHDVDESRRAIERWFDNSMERASGWYKRLCMLYLLVIGLVVAVLFGIDSISIGTRLFHDPQLRATGERLARRIDENPQEMQTWVRRTATNVAVQASGRLDALANDLDPDSTVATAAPLDQARIKEEVRLTAAAAGPAETFFATLHALDASQWDEWSKVRNEVKTSRVCDRERKIQCATTHFESVFDTMAAQDQVSKTKCLAFVADLKKSAGAQLSSDTATAKCNATPTQRPLSNSEMVQAGAMATQQKSLDDELAKTTTSLNGLSDEYADDPDLIAPENKEVFRTARAYFNQPVAAAEASAPVPPLPVPAANGVPTAKSDKPLLAFIKARRNSMAGPNDSQASLLQDVWSVMTNDNKQCPRYTSWKNWFVCPGPSGWFGFVITALMVSLGGPFWYELIGKVVNLRGTGGKPEPGK